MRILIVDDNYSDRALLKYMLSGLGEYIECDDGEIAVKLYKESREEQKPFDFIILDLKMPAMDGLEALEKIREYEKSNQIDNEKQVKVLITTGVDARDAELKLTDNLKVSLCLYKPFSRKKLFDAINILNSKKIDI